MVMWWSWMFKSCWWKCGNGHEMVMCCNEVMIKWTVAKLLWQTGRLLFHFFRLFLWVMQPIDVIGLQQRCVVTVGPSVFNMLQFRSPSMTSFWSDQLLLIYVLGKLMKGGKGSWTAIWVINSTDEGGTSLVIYYRVLVVVWELPFDLLGGSQSM